MIKYKSWDPGERSTGRTSWDEDANPLAMEDLLEGEFDKDLHETPPSCTHFIIEQYRPYGHVNHTGDKLLTAQRIGDIKGYARRNNIQVIEIPAQVKPIAAKWARMKIPPKGTHMPDWQASYLIGYWWLYKEGLIRPRILDE